MSITQRLETIRRRMRIACERSGRDPSSVQLVAVSKSRPVEDLLQAWNAGQRRFGESRVQEARDKVPALPRDTIHWHLIGPLQKNKVRDAARLFHLVESVDSLELAAALSARRTPEDPLEVL
ncbi:MAG: alanine racemase, partial [Magnetococcus sp. WYHC-3]